MSLKEKDIVHEADNYWVFKGKDAYHVMVVGITHSESESSYRLNDDGLSIAKARCNYLAKRKKEKEENKK